MWYLCRIKDSPVSCRHAPYTVSLWSAECSKAQFVTNTVLLVFSCDTPEAPLDVSIMWHDPRRTEISMKNTLSRKDRQWRDDLPPRMWVHISMLYNSVFPGPLIQLDTNQISKEMPQSCNDFFPALCPIIYLTNMQRKLQINWSHAFRWCYVEILHM